MGKERQRQEGDGTSVEAEELQNVVKTHQDSRREHRLVLVGAGYAHLQVVRLLSLSEDQVGFSSITLIDVEKCANYRGMIPGFLSGAYESYQEASIELEKICKQPWCNFVNDGVIDVDLKNKMVYLTDNSTQIPYDVLSFDIGSTTKSLDDIPGAFEYTIPTRPTEELISRLQGMEAQFRQNPNWQDNHELHIAIVGADVSAVELALSIVAKWKPIFQDKLHVKLVSEDDSLANIESTRIGHKRIKEKLNDKGITIHFQESVREVERKLLKLESGMTIPFTYCIWATGAACHDLALTLRDRGLAVSADGWIEVNNCLQSVSHPNVFAAGDCCVPSSLNVPKSGVFSIQEGPVLARNLKLFNSKRKLGGTDSNLHHRHLEQFHPDVHGGFRFVECGDGTAIGLSSGMVIQGRWVQSIKMAMDREFVNWFDHSGRGHHQRPSWDSSQIPIDDDVFSGVLSMMSPAEGAAMLRSITLVNHRQAWWLLKHMVNDVEYRQKVLEAYQMVEETTNDTFGFDIDSSKDGNDLEPSDRNQQQLPKTTSSDVAKTATTPQTIGTRMG